MYASISLSSKKERVGHQLDPYDYQALPDLKESFRLLRLYSASSKADDVTCELVNATINEEIDDGYEVLSWTRDSSNSSTMQIVREASTYAASISQSLEEALKTLRYRDRHRTLWVDRICIDQNRTDERDHHIPLLATIYGKAQKVCVWLGTSTPDSELAMRFIKTDVLDVWKFDKLCGDQTKAKEWKALFELMMHPWFSQRCVAQEVVLATEAIIHCGPETLRWHEFADAVSRFVDVETSTHRLSEILAGSDVVRNFPNFFDNVAALGASILIELTSAARRQFSRPALRGTASSLLSLEYLVSRLAPLQVIEPADAIFSLFAISNDASLVTRTQQTPMCVAPQCSSNHRPLKPFPVDYAKPYLSTATDFVRFNIRTSDPICALDILCRSWACPPQDKRRTPATPQPVWRSPVASLGRRCANADTTATSPCFPSWVCAMDEAAFEICDTPLGARIIRVNADDLVGLPESTIAARRPYSAAGTRRLDTGRLRLRPGPGYIGLPVEGFILDEIMDWEEDVAAQGNIPLAWCYATGWSDATLEAPPDALWRTLVADRGPYGKCPPPSYATACREAMRKGVYGDTIDTHALIKYGRCSVVAGFLKRVQSVIWNRRLIYTFPDPVTKQPRLGLAPRRARKGDLICVLYGCTVPVILRPHPRPQAEVEIEQRERDAIKRQDYGQVIVHLPGGHRRPVMPLWRHRRTAWFQTQQTPLQNPVQRDPLRETAAASFQDSYFELIGACYVHGMMDGEAIRYQEEDPNARATREFEIR